MSRFPIYSQVIHSCRLISRQLFNVASMIGLCKLKSLDVHYTCICLTIYILPFTHCMQAIFGSDPGKKRFGIWSI